MATSTEPGGPFLFGRAFLPDGNETRDQTLFVDEGTGDAFLVRTYYATVDYILPEPVMQPMWESVKRNTTCVGSDKECTHFGLNFHRSAYHLGYDDSDDVCAPRLRQEKLPL